jgi:antibiotic biosynthesis monooxygenase (ABM) superfamily enzyme
VAMPVVTRMLARWLYPARSSVSSVPKS